MGDNYNIFHAAWGLEDPSNGMYQLTRRVCDIAGTEIGDSSTTKHRDGDTLFWNRDHVRGQNVYVFQSYVRPQGERLYELGLFLNGTRSGEPGKMRAVLPFAFGSRGDRRTREKEGINSVVLAKSIRARGAEGIITVGIHNLNIGAIYDALDMSFDNIEFEPIAANYIINKYGDNEKITLLTDPGGMPRIRHLAEQIRNNSRMSPELAMVDKFRPKAGVSKIERIVGRIRGRHVIFYDDIGDTYGTMESSLEGVKQKNPKSLSVILIHGVNSPQKDDKPGAEEMVRRCFDNGLLEELVITDTVPLEQTFRDIEGVKVISVAPLIYETIRLLENNESRRVLYDYKSVIDVYRKLNSRLKAPCDDISLIR